MARIGNTHHFRRCACHHVGVVAGDIAEQHHLGQAAVFFGFGGVSHRLQVAIVQMLQASQYGAAALLLGKHEVLDLHDAGHCVLGIAKKLKADGAGVRRHAVHNPARAGDQTVTTFLLDTRQSAEEFVRDIFAQTFFAEGFARNIHTLGTHGRFAVGFEILELKARHLGVVNLAQVVVQACHLQPLGLGRHHAPGGQVVQCRTPEHGFFAARVHGNVAAYARCFGRGRIDRKNKTRTFGRIGHALGHHAGFCPHRRHGLVKTGQGDLLHLGHGL